MHVHQYLQMHIPGGIVANVLATRAVRPNSTSPEVCQMSQGHQRTPVRTGSGPSVQEHPFAGLPEQMWLEAVPPPVRGMTWQIASCPLDPCPTAAGAARDFTRQILGSWGLLGLAENATVIVSELVTNALRHGACGANGAGHDRVELILLRQPGRMVCVVTDPGAGLPVLVAPGPSAEAGRGLYVIEALAATWGWTRLDAHKKAVWATLGVPGLDGGNGRLGRPALPGWSARRLQPSSDEPARRSPISTSVQPARCRTEVPEPGRVT